MKPGDRIASVDGTPVFTYADFQFRLDKLPRTSKQVQIGVERGSEKPVLTVALDRANSPMHRSRAQSRRPNAVFA